MVSFDKAIPPGGEGKIKITMKTKGYQRPIKKSIRVFTNDNANKIVKLGVEGLVKGYIYLSPRYVYLLGHTGQKVSKEITIKAGLDRPLEIRPTECTLTKNVIYTIKEVEKGRSFLITFTNIPGPAKVFNGTLKLNTNYPEKRELQIRIRGHFRKKSKKPLPQIIPLKKGTPLKQDHRMQEQGVSIKPGVLKKNDAPK